MLLKFFCRWLEISDKQGTKLLCESSNPSRALLKLVKDMNFLVTALQKLPVVVLLVLSALSVTTGDFFAKYWSLHTKNVFYVFAIAGYIGSAIFYIPSLLKKGLVVTSILWSVLSIIGFLAVGLLIFKETLSLRETMGVIFGIISLIILSF